MEKLKGELAACPPAAFLGWPSQRRSSVAGPGAAGCSVLLMVVAMLLVMLVGNWISASRAGWGSNAGRAQSKCDSHGAKQHQ
jgi:hypothetical protein